MTVRAGGKLCHRLESGIRRLRITNRGKAPREIALVTVHLRQVGLVYRTSADVLCVEASRRSQLMFQTKTPLHEVWRMKFSMGYRRDGDRRKTFCGIRLRRCAGKLALCKPRTKRLIGGHRRVKRTVRNSRRNRRAAGSAKKAAL